MLKATVFIAFAAACAGQAQFDVVAIKPHPVEGRVGRLGSPLRISGDHVTLGVVTLNELIGIAYEVRDFQISGSPSWATQGSDRYDIDAKAPGDAVPTISQARQMLQTVLKERFKLAFHRDSKEFAVYHLTIGKDGAKVKAVEEGSPAPVTPTMRLPMETLDNLIAGLLDRPLIDKTGFTGRVDFKRDFAALDKDQLSITTAVEESLGLKLESVKDLMPVLVVEYVERPSAN